MANALFAAAKQSFLSGGIDLTSNTIKVAMVDHGVDTPVPATDANLSDITGGAIVGTAQTLGSKTVTGGVFNAAPVTYTAVTGASVESLVIYKDTGSSATSSLILFIDTATGLPVTPNSGNITVTWDSGSSKIFSL